MKLLTLPRQAVVVAILSATILSAPAHEVLRL